MVNVRVAQFKGGKFLREYNSVNEAAKSVNGQPSHISECMRHIPHRHTHKGYEWRNIGS